MVWTGVPPREYLFKDPEKGHDNESDQGQISYDDDGYVHREEEELMEEGSIFSNLMTKDRKSVVITAT